MTGAKNYFVWQSDLVTRELGRRVLEIGCGVGNFTEKLLDRDLVIALDIEPECVQELLRRYPGRQNLRAFVLDAGARELRGFAGCAVDSCVCVNVLEHIEDDAGALEGMRSILVPGGVVVLIVPAFPALYGPIDANLGHYRRYSRRGIARLAERARERALQALIARKPNT